MLVPDTGRSRGGRSPRDRTVRASRAFAIEQSVRPVLAILSLRASSERSTNLIITAARETKKSVALWCQAVIEHVSFCAMPGSVESARRARVPNAAQSDPRSIAANHSCLRFTRALPTRRRPDRYPIVAELREPLGNRRRLKTAKIQQSDLKHF